MLPAQYGSSLNLSDVFRSAELSLKGQENPLKLPKVASALVILVDGLGFLNLRQQDKGFLSSKMQDGDFAICGFPSTTTSSITSFATGKSVSQHGFFGYTIFNRSTNETVNMLSGLDRLSVLEYLKSEPISSQSNLPVHAVTLSEYEDSGFTRVTMQGARHHFAQNIDERLRLALQVATSERGSLTYVYIPELDKIAHKSGVASQEWREKFERVDACIREIASALPTEFGVLVTADHGVLDIDAINHIYLDEFLDCDDSLLSVCGDPRAPFLYFNNSVDVGSLQSRLVQQLQGNAFVLTPIELVEHGYWSAEMLQDDDLLPDLVVMAWQQVAFFHRKFSSQASQKMIGHHGSISETEVKVPLIRLGGYSSSLLVP